MEGNKSEDIGVCQVGNKEVKAEEGSVSGLPAASSEEQMEYPSQGKITIVVIGLMLVISLAGLDVNIVGTAAPSIVSEFNSLNDVGWYGAAYLLCMMALQGIYGNLFKIWGAKWVLMGAIAMFEIGSIICATAPSSPVFILGRAISGSGGAGNLAGCLAVVTDIVPLEKRPVYIAIVASFFGVTGAIAPILSGVFTSSKVLKWRFCFWINLPIGVLAAVIILLGYKPRRKPTTNYSLSTTIKRLDIAGTVFLLSASTCLLLALQWGGIRYSWRDSTVWGCLIGFALLLSSFIAVQVYLKDSGTLPLSILRRRSVACSCLYIAGVFAAQSTILYYVPFYFQTVQGVGVRDSGVRMLPLILAAFITATLVGAIVTKTGVYVPFMWACGAVYAIGCGMLHTLDLHSPSPHWIGFLLLTGFGFGLGFQLPYTVIQACLSGPDVLSGNGLTAFSQALGGVVGVSIAQNIFSSTLEEQLRSRGLAAAQFNVADGAMAIIGSDIPEQLKETVHEAFGVAVSRTLILTIVGAGLAFLMSLGLEWRSVQRKSKE